MSWRRFFRRSDWDRERARELESYLQIEAEENIARGMTPEEARYAARRKLGSTTRIREEIYRMNSLGWLETLWQDLRYAARLLRLNPGFAAVAILSLALGIGANTAIFQLLDAVRLRNLPVKNPQELAEVRVDSKTGRSGSFRGRYPRNTNPIWELIRDQQQAFSSISAWGPTSFDLSTGGEVRLAQGLWVSGDFFRTLGVSPILGRVFTAEDDRRGCGGPGAVISYGFWQHEFGGEPSVIGRKLSLDGYPFTVIGVTQPGFTGVDVGHAYDVAVPICSEALLDRASSRLDRRWAWWLVIIGRLKPGWSLARAEAHMRALAPGIFQATVPTELPVKEAKNYTEFQLAVKPASTGISEVRQTYEDPLWLLIAISGVVLLIACANLANLLLARASAREREIAVRLTIGASRWRLVRQLLAESLLLAVIGAGLGVLLARNLSHALVSYLTTSQDRISLDLQINGVVLGFATGLAVLTCLLFGLAPALRATRIEPAAAMKAGGGRGLTATRERYGLQRVLVASQVALSLVLLFGALLFVRSLQNLTTLDMGFRADGVLSVELDLRRAGYPPERFAPVNRELLERLRATPGVASAAEAYNYPMGNGWSNDNIRMEGPEGQGKDWAISNFSRVSPDFFRTTAMPLLAGRDLNDGDTIGSPEVAIVNEIFARKFLGGANPIGKRFRVQTGPGEPELVYQIVGLVGNTKYETLREDFKPIAFVASSQVQHRWEMGSSFLVRSNLPLRDLISSLQQSISRVNPAISVDFTVLKTRIQESVLEESLMATLSSFFGILAALLATIGLYGVLSYMVARRRNEIGIRMALGATRAEVALLVMRDAGKCVAIGLAGGIVLGLAAARTANAMLYGLRPSDPFTLAMAVAGLTAVAALASYLPARRAAQLEPMAALRDE